MWAQRAMKFEVINRYPNEIDPSVDLSGLGKIVVQIRKASKVESIQLNRVQYQSIISNYSYEHSAQHNRYLSMYIAGKSVEESGITDLVLFGPDRNSPALLDLDYGRKSNKLTDTRCPLDQVTYMRGDNDPYAKFTFYHRFEGEQTYITSNQK